MRPIRQLGLLIAFTASLSATAANAQGSRPAMVDSARALIDAFNERQSIGLLRRALNPALGAPDASWERAVQLLGQTLLQTNQRDEAVAWLRWALRQSPSLKVDSVNFTPALVTALNEARVFVAASRIDPRALVRFEWSTATTSGGYGDVRVGRGGGDTSIPVQLSVNGEFLDEGGTRRLSPGSYRIAARAAGQSDAELTAEVLPGVTTLVTVNFVTAVVGMSQATERFVLSRLARVDHGQSPGVGCKVGFFAGGPALLIARYSAVRGNGQLALKPADASIAPERVRGIAAYDSSADLAVLSMTAPRVDSLLVSADVRAGTALWAAHFPACGETPTLARVSVAAISRDSITLAQDAPGADQLGVLVNATGAVTGFLTGPRSARTLGGASSLMASARANVAAGGPLAVSEVAQPKKRSKMLPIAGGVVVGGIIAALAMGKSDSSPTTGGIVLHLPQ